MLLRSRAANCGLNRCFGSAGASPSHKRKVRRFNKAIALHENKEKSLTRESQRHLCRFLRAAFDE
jgi:hypothetical protein